MDFEFCADVHALGGLVEHEDAGVRGQPLGQDHLLLVAAAEAVGEYVLPGGLDPPLREKLVGLVTLFGRPDSDVTGSGARGEHQVVA